MEKEKDKGRKDRGRVGKGDGKWYKVREREWRRMMANGIKGRGRVAKNDGVF